MSFWIYILECADHSLYVGHTDDLDRRMSQHDVGIVGCYTFRRRPLKLVYAEAMESRYMALTLERQIKGWSRAKKLAFIAGDWKKVGELAKGKHRQDRE